MISRLKSRPRFDRLQTEKRNRRSGLGRYMYLGLLVVFGLWLFELALGDIFFLRADGFVLRARHLAAVPFTAKVVAVHVEDGQRVEKGFRMMQMHSPEFARDLAQLSVRVADLEIRLAELQSKAEVLKEMLPFAEKRARKASEVIELFESDLGKKHVPPNRMAAALKDEFEAMEELRRVSSEYASIAARLGQVEVALERASHALEVTTELYANGEVDAVVSGTAVEVRAAVGQIVREGEPVVEIRSGPRYVLAYTPPGALFDIREGDRVLVRYGVRTTAGVVTETLPVAGELPPEFQRAFRPKERAQMFKVAIFVLGEPPPLLTKVEILSHHSVRARVIRGFDELGRAFSQFERLWDEGNVWIAGLAERLARITHRGA